MSGARPARHRRGAHRIRPKSARRPVRRRLPSAARLGAAAMLVAAVAVLAALTAGPWLRVARASWQGERYTPTEQIAAAVQPATGHSLVTLDTAQLADRLRALPAVADARVDARLPDELRVEITEKRPAAVWQTSAARLIVAGDGAVIGALAVGAEPPGELSRLPLVDDRRSASRDIIVGGRLPAGSVGTALQLAALDPASMGSSSRQVSVLIDDQYGFVVVSARPDWSAAFGFYGLDRSNSPAAGGAQIRAQVDAVRTLFANRAESTIAWVDARNPGKVYFRAKG
ncbi:MAG: cell division protein FtsQ/DivIB [Candidatus Limnocylindria bacterium]